MNLVPKGQKQNFKVCSIIQVHVFQHCSREWFLKRHKKSWLINKRLISLSVLKDYVKHTGNKRLEYRIYQSSYNQFKKAKQPKRKICKKTCAAFHWKYPRPMKRCSASWVFREIVFKATVRLFYIHSVGNKLKSFKTLNIGEDVNT